MEAVTLFDNESGMQKLRAIKTEAELREILEETERLIE